LAESERAAQSNAARPGRSEDREIHEHLQELIEEVRVALPGVQILFAFLLNTAFSQRFTALDATTKAVFFGALLCSALTSILLIAPSAFHRIQHGQTDLSSLIGDATALVIIGTLTMAIALTASSYVVATLLYSPRIGLLTAAGTGVTSTLFWFALPIARRLSSSREARI
jgi:hypothetical protein